MCLHKTNIYLIFSSCTTCKFNRAHVTKSNRYALDFIYHKLIPRSKTTKVAILGRVKYVAASGMRCTIRLQSIAKAFASSSDSYPIKENA